VYAKIALGFLLITLPPFSSAGLAQSFSSRSATGGVTYYVDSMSGSDTHSGASPAAAWKTLGKINATTFAPGDTVLFKSGSAWTGQLWPKGSGKDGQPIRIDRYAGGAKPVIRAASGVENAVLLKNQEYWEINNLEITNHGEGTAVRRGVYVLAENCGELHHVYLRHLTIHDVNGTDDNKVNGGINYNSIGDSKPSRFVDLRIEDNNIDRVDRSGIFGWSTHWVRSKWYPSLGVSIRNNVLTDIGGDGIVVVATDGALVEYNVVGRANQRSAGYDVAIWAWSADNTVVQYNEAYLTRGQRDGEGFDSDWNSRNTIIQYNYSHDNEGGFLLICNEGGDGVENIGNTGTIVRYNISQNDHHRGINLAGPINDSHIYNNTIYVGKNEKVDLLLFSDWGGWSSKTYLYNNIFYVEGSGQFSYAVSRAGDGAHATAAGFGQSRENVLDYNIFYGNVKAAEDPHALTTNPLLADPGRAGTGRKTLAGYRLRAASPAINSGKMVEHDGGIDFFGNAVPACGGVDRGAVERESCPTRGSGGPLRREGD